MIARIKLYLKLKPLALLAHWRHVLIGKHAKAVLTETWNGLILVPATDFFIGRRLAYRGGHNQEMVSQLLNIVDESSDVLIVGAHVGTILIPLAKRCRSVVGVEANPKIFHLLQTSVLLNGLGNVQLINVAASDEAGELRFIANEVNTGGSKVYRNFDRRYEFFYDDPEIITVQSARLDQLLEGRSFDVVVVDIEGSEYKALKGMRDILLRAEYLVLEVLPNHIENVAGVSKGQFIDVIPETFSRASVLGGRGKKESYKRSELIGLFDNLWKENRGVDLLFAVEREGD